MATQGLIIDKISDEAQEVMSIIQQKDNFVLSGGAGSGKTYSLVEIIKSVINEQPLDRIACITYTNAAVKEIEERIEHPNLNVSTIHDFLWGNIKHFQKELKATLAELIEDETYPSFILPEGTALEPNAFDKLEKGIQYKEFLRLKEGIISHDELLIIAGCMYSKYDKLNSITKDNFPFIFVDEYQDTNNKVVEILLEHLKKSNKLNVVGFFGDSMQSIYPNSVGNLDNYKGNSEGQVREVKKEQNRRNPKLVIDLANRLRNDGLIQQPSDDLSAPNMNQDGTVKQGIVNFIYSDDDNLQKVKEYLAWDFNDSKQTKELNLTHNLIANKAGFEDLMRVYDGDKILDYVKRIRKYIKNNIKNFDSKEKTFNDVITELAVGKTGGQLNAVLPTNGMNLYIRNYQDIYHKALNTLYDEISVIYIDKEQLLDDKKSDESDKGKIGSQRDDLIKHLFKIQHNVRLYQEKKFNEFLRKTDFRVSSQDAKIRLKAHIESLVNVGKKSISDVINEANISGIVQIDDRLIKFMEKKKYVYDQVAELPFAQFQNLYEYLEGFTPFSTQHKTKGAEYPNVLVILDNGNWNSYNFSYLFTGQGTESVLHRTQKIFYVCCTRAKEKLAVFFHQPSQDVIIQAKEWFGDDNVINLDL